MSCGLCCGCCHEREVIATKDWEGTNGGAVGWLRLSQSGDPLYPWLSHLWTRFCASFV